MSQSDYIKYKKTSYQLVEQNKLDPVLGSQYYTAFKEFSIENSISNSKIIHSQLQHPNSKIIFDIETFRTGNCPNFIVCNNTNTRPNRKLTYLFSCSPLLPKNYNKKSIQKTENCNKCFTTNNGYSHKMMYYGKAINN
jgi:hypothetical protein